MDSCNLQSAGISRSPGELEYFQFICTRAFCAPELDGSKIKDLEDLLELWALCGGKRNKGKMVSIKMQVSF